MATRTLRAHNLNRENAGAGAAKVFKAQRTTRAALDNIGNKENLDVKPRLAKSHALLSLKSAVNKENAVKIVKVEKEKKDVSIMETSQSGEEAFSSHFTLPPNVIDIDKDDRDNPQLVSEYVNEIYKYMRDLEAAYPIKARYLDGTDLSGKMRTILIDWLVQVHVRFHLLQETLYLTVAIIDRYLAQNVVPRTQLQLVGVTSMLIASKYEEMYAPEVNDFVYITDNAYSKDEIHKMEVSILFKLGFNFGRPLPLHFLRRNSKAGEVDATTHTLAKYLMELTIVDYDSCHYNPSQIGAAALCLSLKVMDCPQWSETLSFFSSYTEQEITPVMCRIAYLVTRAGKGSHTAIRTKYQSSKFMKISTLPQLSSQLIKDYASRME